MCRLRNLPISLIRISATIEHISDMLKATLEHEITLLNQVLY